MHECSNEAKIGTIEANLDFIKQTLQEIKADVKLLARKEDHDRLEVRVQRLEDMNKNLMIKVGIISGVIGSVAGFFIKMFS